MQLNEKVSNILQQNQELQEQIVVLQQKNLELTQVNTQMRQEINAMKSQQSSTYIAVATQVRIYFVAMYITYNHSQLMYMILIY